MAITAIIGLVTTWLTGFGISAAVATGIGILGGALVYGGIIFGGYALLKSSQKKKTAFSPSYDGVLQTQTDQSLPIPLLYGTVKLAGNRIWQDDNTSSTIKRLVGFSCGEIEGFEDIRLNNIEMNKIPGIQVRKYYGTQNQTVDPIVGGSTPQERAEMVGGLRNLAYLAVSVPKSNDIDGNYNLTAVVKGRKIRVYRDINNYEVKYSENPAWVMFDFLTSYNGLGLCLNTNGEIDETKIQETFDLESFIESAAFCDERVVTNGISSPRFTFNMIFDVQLSARDLLDEIYRSCRGGLFLKNGKLQFKIDKAEAISKVFTADDIVKGSEKFQCIPKEEHYDILKIVYISPEHEWQKVEAYAEIPEYKDSVPLEHSINCYSVTNFQQASRLAWYYVNSKILQPYFGSFQTDYRAYDLEVGDVIAFDSLLMGLNQYTVKVTSVIDDGAGTFTVNWRTYDPNLYNDTLGSGKPALLVSNLSDLYGYPDDIRSFNVVQKDNLFNFVWTYNQSAQDTYEIRMGESWEKGEVIGTNIVQNTFTSTISAKGTYKFWIKAWNKYNYSQNPTLDVVVVSEVPNLNEVATIDILENPNGTHDNTYFYKGNLKSNVQNILWHTTENPWGSDTYYQNGGFWGANVVDNGVYTSQIYDIGQNLESIVSNIKEYQSKDDQGDVLIEWRTSQNGELWGDWQIFNMGSYTFQYFQVRITLKAYNNVPIQLSKLIFTVVTPDKFEVREAEITDANQGITINYNFVKPPSIVASVNDGNEAYAVITEKTNSYAVIKAYGNDGSLKTAVLSIYMKGY